MKKPAETRKTRTETMPELVVGPDAEPNGSVSLVVTAPDNVASEVFPNFGERYEVLANIGHGGMGTVYKVRDREIDKIFAIKVLRPELSADQIVVKRFAQEAKTAAELTHASIAAVYNSGQTKDGNPFLVMEFFEGEPLSQVLKDGALDEARGLDSCIQICEALAHAHMKGVVHRDLKPSNIILTKASVGGADLVHLVDFGIAKVSYGDVRALQDLTQTGDILGSPSYMSPEQCLGLALDARSDIYSFGCVMHEIFTGKQAFSGDNPIQIIANHLNDGTVASISKKLKELKIPQNLRLIILRCLESDSSNRYQSIEQVLQDLMFVRSGGNLRPKKANRDRILLTPQQTVSLTLAFAGILYVFDPILHERGVSSYGISSAVFVACLAWFVVFLVARIAKNLASKPMGAHSAADRGLLFGHMFLAMSFLLALPQATKTALWELAQRYETPALYWLIFGWMPNWLQISSCMVAIITVLLAVVSYVFWLCSTRFPKSGPLVAIGLAIALCIFGRGPMTEVLIRIAQGSNDYDRQHLASSMLAQKLPYYNEVLWIDPSNVSALVLRAYLYSFCNQTDLALKDYDHLLALKPDPEGGVNPSVLYADRGRVYRQTRQYDKALEDFTEAVRLEKTPQSTLLDRAQCYAEMGNSQAALIDLTELLWQSPGVSSAYDKRAGLYEQEGKFEAALADYTKAIDLEPDNFREYKKRADVFRQLGKEHLAAADLSAVLTLIDRNIYGARDDGEREYYRAVREKETGKLELAKVHAQKARDLGYRADDWQQFGLK